MKCGKAVGTSLIVAGMLKSSGVEGAKQICDLIEDIIHFGTIPIECEETIIVSLYSGKGTALELGNYRGLKLLDQVMKVVERVTENFVRQHYIDDMQFSFMPGHSTTDAILFARQSQENFCAINTTLCMAFVDLDQAFNRVPRHAIWSALHKLGVGVAGAANKVCMIIPESKSWLQPEWRIQCESWCSPGFLLEAPIPLVCQRSLWCVSQGRRHKIHFLWWLFQ